ncbi:MAG: hypothetical protein JSW71_09005 [Gemmatimonadota bacterium]|nr:MAG: hypothetical protein JSW71_09005 [Gemmatimonadota bacterium]
MHTPSSVISAVLGLAVVVGADLQAQSAADVINRMVSAYERQTRNVENYTIVQETMGVETVSYFEKEMVSGHPVFHMRQVVAGGMVVTGDEAEEERWDEFYTMAPEIIERATYEGRDNIDGNSVHVVSVRDLHEIGLGPGMSRSEDDFEPTRATLFIDTDESLMRRMVFEGVMTTDGESHDVTSTVEFRDYREVDGMIHPFLTTMTMEGLGEAMDPEAQKQYEEMKKELEGMPEAQRKMVEEMMKGQMAQYEQMMSGGGGMTVEVRVKEVRVNSGPPGGQ